jgi:hypothetical protein
VDEPGVIRLPGIGGRIERDELRLRTREVDNGTLGGEDEDASCLKRAQRGLICMVLARRLPWWIARSGAANPTEHDRVDCRRAADAPLTMSAAASDVARTKRLMVPPLSERDAQPRPTKTRLHEPGFRYARRRSRLLGYPYTRTAPPHGQPPRTDAEHSSRPISRIGVSGRVLATWSQPTSISEHGGEVFLLPRITASGPRPPIGRPPGARRPWASGRASSASESLAPRLAEAGSSAWLTACLYRTSLSTLRR